jgi:4a-hydroxytetrahydrobiopterin dehydratase
MKTSDTKDSTVETPALLPPNEARESLKKIDGWQSTDDQKMIYREFILHNFMDAVHMIEQIAVIAEDEQHHPDLHLTQYRNLRVGLRTHEVGGLSDKDFAVAGKINSLSSKTGQATSSTPPKRSSKPKRIKAKKVLNRVHQRTKKHTGK